MIALVIRSSDIDRCPLRSLSASHYFRDDEGEVRCQCEVEAYDADVAALRRSLNGASGE